MNQFLHTAIIVKNPDTAADFLRRAFGWEMSGKMSIPGRVEIIRMSHGSGELELLHYADDAEELPASRYYGLAHIAVDVSDLEGEMGRLEGLGATLIDKIPRSLPDGSRVAFLNCLDGLQIELIERAG
jgi:catechol 2,3-dioxygenase-like lactoylglutathione lyase family enzyme